ncbi:hypothetical protein [Aquibacillus kalidii]|uniref:hypothetical protein n=1 Tax=Aquibacillus kalidii TaxID=2762597 RepID=UPI001646CFA6|nr:hypothetical protein [Aquibacillus kalidii]
MDFQQYRNEIMKTSDQLSSLMSSFWKNYSGFGTWQFWVVISLLIIPLVLLYIKIDRSRIFELFVFGYTVHILWSYVDIILERYNYMIHPYSLTPILPYALNITTSVLPVGFILLYQYCTNNNKNFYIYTVILSGIFSFLFASIEMYIGLLEVRKGFNLICVFGIDVGITVIAYWFTHLCHKLKSNS